MFRMLELMNEQVGEKEKYELLKLLVKWISDNDLAGIALDALKENDGQIGECVKALNLEVGEISLTD